MLWTLFTLSLASVVFAQNCDNPVNRLETDDIPVLDLENSGFLSADTLTFKISSLLVNERSDASIILSNSESDCNYPGPYWTRTANDQPGGDCVETWTATMPWSVARECDLIREEDETTVVYTGEINVMQLETLGNVRGTPITRDLATGFLYELTFPKVIDLQSADVQVFAPINLIAAVIGQDFAVEEATGSALLFTSVQYPFMLTEATVSTAMTDGTTIEILLPVGQNCPENAPCETIYDLELVPGACSLSGQFTLSFDFACHPEYDESDCPLQGESGSVNFILESQDLCAVLRENVDLTGELRSYLSDFTTLRDAFLLEQTMYWSADVQSTKVSIVDSAITHVDTTFNGGTASTLYTDGLISGIGGLTNFALVAGGGATINRFQFDALPNLYPVPEDEFRAAVVRCTVAVTYDSVAAKREVTRYSVVPLRLGLGGHSLVRRSVTEDFAKRQLPAQQQQPLVAEAQVALTGSSSLPAENPTAQPEAEGGMPGFIPAIIAAAAACCLMALFAAGVAVRRSRRQEQTMDLPEVDPHSLPSPAHVNRTNSKTLDGKLYSVMA